MTGADPTPLRVLFFGTPEFALPSLEALVRIATVVAVVSQPDRPAGRGRRLTPPPVAAAARRMGLPLLQPARLRDPVVLDALRALAPELGVTVAYGRLLPPAVLALPPLGCINLHPSLLPRYRGASPIQAAIADGAAVTGVTVLYMTDELDAGDIILQQEVPIHPEETAGELEARLAHAGAALLAEAVRLLAAGAAPRRPQDHAQATYTGRLSKADGLLDWTRPAVAIVNQIRALTPWPSAYTYWRGMPLKIWRARAVAAAADGQPGEVVAVSADGITVAAGAGTVLLLEVQPPGGVRMPAGAFARGHPIRPGDLLGGAPVPGKMLE
ncbi:MAG: methionyl-tRNA formyltransferase [Armatimonadota bacterium]|nr:methionyl-tRNA formyltransferase [Armatimonadota bacterium]MDR7533940.1 methionyl-tRNA formyltransferase [Armatimonadota bacterium]MDR7536046.1 methionyl-tRNA formyltransferase [Armatimonadota bacterium]